MKTRTSKSKPGRKRTPGRRFLRKLLLAPVILLTGYYTLCAVLLVLYIFVSPPSTGVQMQRRVESFFADGDYTKRYDPVSRDRLSKHLLHAVVAAEDQRFYDHFGVDWKAIDEAIKDNRRRGRSWRGGSTITQQLVKNLFMTTHSSYIRKAIELPLTYMAEIILTKDRILTLYVNVIEMGKGVYGAEAASRYYYDKPAAKLTRHQAASLAAIIPSPRRRSPQRMGKYTSEILRRMNRLGY